MDETTRIFETERPRLISLCYRILGECAAAEDAVQDCWLRWAEAGPEGIANARAWLTRVATRIAIDMLRSARARRECYVGPWLPEPLVVSAGNPAEAAFAQAQDCELALLCAMERLTPAERAALILRDVLETDYPEIAQTLGKSQAACRQLVSRARRRVRTGAPRFDVAPERTAELLAAFLKAAATGDAAALKRLIAPEAMAVSDGGPNARAARRVLRGPEEIAHVVLAIRNRADRGRPERCEVNGQPGIMLRTRKRVHSVATLLPDGHGRIAWLYTMRAPEKLSRVA